MLYILHWKSYNDINICQYLHFVSAWLLDPHEKDIFFLFSGCPPSENVNCWSSHLLFLFFSPISFFFFGPFFKDFDRMIYLRSSEFCSHLRRPTSFLWWLYQAWAFACLVANVIDLITDIWTCFNLSLGSDIFFFFLPRKWTKRVRSCCKLGWWVMWFL